jgi:predicted ester cyclase
LVAGLPDLRADVKWVVADGDMVVLFLDVTGTHQGRLLFVEEPTGNPVHTSFMLALRFDDDGQVIDQWLGSNFVEILAQLGWGFAPFGEPTSAPFGEPTSPPA